jgi:hypothetical protein
MKDIITTKDKASVHYSCTLISLCNKNIKELTDKYNRLIQHYEEIREKETEKLFTNYLECI